MYEVKKIGKLFTSKFVWTGSSSYKNRIYRAAVSQRLRNTSQQHVLVALHPGKNPITHLLGSWVGPRASLGILEKRKIAFSCRDSNPDRPGHSLGSIMTTLSHFLRIIQCSEVQQVKLLGAESFSRIVFLNLCETAAR